MKPLQEGEWTPKTLQREIIERFLNEEQRKQFFESYANNRKHYRVSNRFMYLNAKITEQEMEMLAWYFNDEAVETAKEYAEKLGIKTSALMFKCRAIVAKYLYQNKDRIGL